MSDTPQRRNGVGDFVIFDDPIRHPDTEALHDVEALHAAAIQHEVNRIYDLIAPEFTRGGAYRNRRGEMVTWDASEDGSYVVVQTWPRQ